MSQEQLKSFLNCATSNQQLLEQLKAADDPKSVVSIAKNAGFAIDIESFISREEVSNRELEGAAGGGSKDQLLSTGCGTKYPWCPMNTYGCK